MGKVGKVRTLGGPPQAAEDPVQVRVICAGPLGPKGLMFGEITDDPEYVAVLDQEGQTKVEELVVSNKTIGENTMGTEVETKEASSETTTTESSNPVTETHKESESKSTSESSVETSRPASETEVETKSETTVTETNPGVNPDRVESMKEAAGVADDDNK